MINSNNRSCERTGLFLGAAGLLSIVFTIHAVGNCSDYPPEKAMPVVEYRTPGLEFIPVHYQDKQPKTWDI